MGRRHDTPSDERRTDDAPGLGRAVVLVASAVLALGIGWLALYAAYRYLGSGW